MSQPLLKCGPFVGLQTSKEDFYLDPGYGANASNVDVSENEGAFTAAYGRALYGQIAIPTGYALQCVVPFVYYTGDNPVSAKRVYVFSSIASSADRTGYQGYFDPSGGTTTQLSALTPFTQAVQFGARLWTNGGSQVFAADLIYASPWQIQVPSTYAFNINGTSVTQAGSATLQQYQYAITIRASKGWQTQTGPPLIYMPDFNTYQESSPIFSGLVTTSTGQQPAVSVATSVGTLAALNYGVLVSLTYYGALYRWSAGSPAFQFVDYLINLPTGTGADGNPCWIDTTADATIASNEQLWTHHDPPPIIGQVYPGPLAPNAFITAQAQANQKVAFAYTNPSFIKKFKNRMWAFTLYPQQPIGQTNVGVTDAVTLQPQLWASDYGQPWSFNDDPANGQVFVLAPDDTPGNRNIDAAISTNPPWEPGLLEDTPMGLAVAGSELVCFRSQSAWIMQVGDSLAERSLNPGFNIGCMATNSITEAEGGIFWLAPQGVYFYSGGAPAYISEDVRELIDGMTWAQRQAAVGSYQDRTFFLSLGGTTLCYYTPTRKWYTRPYAASLAVFSPANQNQLLFVNASFLESVNADPGGDMGSPIVATWTSNLTDSEMPGILKQYRFMQVTAPQQAGTVTASLTVDAQFATTQTFSWTWDLSKGNGAFVVSLPDYMAGYNAQLTLTATTVPGATSPLIIRQAMVFGDPSKHGLKSTTDQDGSGVLNGVLHG